MTWNAGHYHELSAVTPQLQLASPLSYLPLDGSVLPWVGTIGAFFSLRSICKAIVEAGERRRKQREYWTPILSSAELNSYRVVCGGRRGAFADQVRGRLLLKANSALLELIFPPVLQTLHPFQSSADFVEGLLARSDVASRIETLGALASNTLVSTNRSPLQFMHRVRLGTSKLLLPVGGHVSNAVVEQQLRDTHHSRHYRVVAVSATNQEAHEITMPEEVASIRRRKALLLLGIPQAAEHTVLDTAIRYELWKGHEPAVRPHVESTASELATDYAYVVFTRNATGEAVLSVQALHALSLTAMSLFHSPHETLGSDAQSFRDHALSSMHASRSIGFEAILKVQRTGKSARTETPRDFDGEPTRSNRLKVSMHAPPTPIYSA